MGAGLHHRAPRTPTPTSCQGFAPLRGPGPAQRPAHRVPGVTQVEQQAAVFGLIAAVGGSCQVKKSCLNASSDALHHLLAQHQVWELQKAVGDKGRAMALSHEVIWALSWRGRDMGGEQGLGPFVSILGIFLHEPIYSHPNSVRKKHYHSSYTEGVTEAQRR